MTKGERMGCENAGAVGWAWSGVQWHYHEHERLSVCGRFLLTKATLRTRPPAGDRVCSSCRFVVEGESRGSN